MNDTPKLPALQSGAAVKAIVPQDFDGAYRIARAVVTAGMAPKGLDTPEKAMVAIMHGMEVGLTPMASLQSIAVVNGRPTIWGDGALALVQGSGLMESFEERLEGEGDARRAICIVKRRGNPHPVTGLFSVGDAKTAGLWGRSGPWQQYPDRMLKMRARGFALRDGFSDVLRGLGIAEEVQDTPMRDITPPRPPEPPMPPADLDPMPTIDETPAEPEAVDTDFLETLEAEFSACTTPEELEDVWTARDPMAVFQGDDEMQALCLGMKARFLKRIGGA